MPHRLTDQRLKRARLALFAMFFTQGITAITTLPRIPELIHQINVNFAVWGAIMGFAGLGSLVPLVFTNKLVARFGTSPIIRLSAFAMVFALVAQAWITSPFLFFLVIFFQSFTLSTFNIALNSQAVMLQKQIGRVIIGAFHGSWSIGAAISAALSGWLAGFMPLWLHLLLVAAGTGLVFQVAGSQLLKPNEDGHASESSRDRGVSWLKTPKYIWLLAIGLFAGMFPELVIMDWTAVFSRDVLHVDATRGAWPYTVFVAAMIVGRFASAPLTKRIHFSTMSAVGGFVGSVALALVATVAVLARAETVALAVMAIQRTPRVALAVMADSPELPAMVQSAGVAPLMAPMARPDLHNRCRAATEETVAMSLLP